MQRAVVIGSSPAALRAATVLARRGIAPRVLATSETASGMPVAPPFGLGAVGVRDGEDDRLRAVAGEIADVGLATRGVWVGGRILELPLQLPALTRALGAGAPRAIGGVARARARERLGNVLDLGHEERSYEDFVAHRVGGALYEAVYAPWARKRFGADPVAITAWTGWWAHARPAPSRYVAPATDSVAVEARQRAAILDAGGEVLEGVAVEAIEVEGGRVVAVLTDHGRESVERGLWVDVGPRSLVRWLPDAVADEAWRFDAGRLRSAHAVQVTVSARVGSLPFELFVVDEDLPFWRLTRPGLLPGESQWTDAVTAHLTLADDDPLWRADDALLAEAVTASIGRVADVRAGDAVVQRWPDAVPIGPISGARSLARRLDAMDAVGIVGVGPRGAFRHLDEAEEVALVEGVLDLEPPQDRASWQREIHRARYERPVRLPPRMTVRTGFSE